MAALSNSNIKRKTVVMGPFKAEFVWSTEAVTDGSFTSDLQRPIVAGVGVHSGSATSMVSKAEVAGRTISLTDLLGAIGVSFIVIGF